MKRRYEDASPYLTKDGSTIRELLHPGSHPEVKNQSLAEARVPAGGETLLHRHQRSEEIYHVTAGEGWMTLDNERFSIGAGDSIAIPPGTAHKLENSGEGELVVLCCCAPAYTHEDTEIIEAAE